MSSVFNKGRYADLYVAESEKYGFDVLLQKAPVQKFYVESKDVCLHMISVPLVTPGHTLRAMYCNIDVEVYVAEETENLIDWLPIAFVHELSHHLDNMTRKSLVPKIRANSSLMYTLYQSIYHGTNSDNYMEWFAEMHHALLS